MKITFLLPNRKRVESPYDFGKYRDKYSFNYYLLIKGLEFNEDFVKKVQNFRLENHIDESNLYERMMFPTVKTLAENTIISSKLVAQSESLYVDLLEHAFKAIENLSFNSLVAKINLLFSELNISKSTERFYINYYAIAEIVLFGTVRVKKHISPLYWIPHVSDSGLSTIGIYIGSDISKQQLKKYIDEIFEKEIQPAFKKIQMRKNIKTRITEREFYVLQSRLKQKMRYKKIAELLEKNNLDLDTNEDMVKKIFKRAKAKIDSI